MATKKIYEISLESEVSCSNLDVQFDKPECINIKCLYDSSTNSIKITVPEDCEPECIYATVTCLDDKCDDCETTQDLKICPCTGIDDCDDCEACIDNICVSLCDEDEFCKNDTCVECDEANPCPDGKNCNNGNCECPPGTYENADGKCVECENGDTNGCLLCVNGEWVPRECEEGVCDPDDGDCVDCLKSGDCTGVNECCVDKDCVCCPGYVRNPVTGECEPKGPCEKDSDCPECEICTDEGCQPVVCPEGFICVDGDCVPECDCSEGGCPDGSACVPHPTQVGKCYCKDCTQFECDGECENEYGCGCDEDNNCVPDDSCNLEDIDLEWVYTEGEPGSPTGSETALILDSVSIEPEGLIYNGGTDSVYMNYRFSATVSNNNSGQWYYTNGVNDVPLGPGDFKSVTLEDLQQNLGFFALEYRDSDPCNRTLTIPFSPNFNIDNPLQASSNGWIQLPVSNSGGCNGYAEGGTPGYWSLCVNGATDFVIDHTSINVVTNDSIYITLAPQEGNCSRATISGCGLANGTVDVVCKDITQTVAFPEFYVDFSCCDPSDPACVTTGGPCEDITQVDIPIEIMPLYGTNAEGTTSEAVALVNVIDLINNGTISAAGLLNIAYKFCWSASGNPDSDNNGNEVVEEGNTFGQGYNNPFEYKFDYEAGACVYLGHTCDIISNCKQYKGQACIDACDDFEILVIETGVTDNQYYIIPSNFGYVTGDNNWTVRVFTTQNGSGTPINEFTNSPNDITYPLTVDNGPAGTKLTALAYYVDVMKISTGSKIKRIEAEIVLNECTGDGFLTRSTTGCTDPNACNYDESADTDDGSCIYVANEVTHPCDGSGIQNATPGVIIYVDGFPTAPGTVLTEGEYEVYVVNGSGCASETDTVIVNCCGDIVIENVDPVCDDDGDECYDWWQRLWR